MSTLIVGTIVIGSMIFVAIRLIKKHKSGDGSCGCGCSGCSNSKTCHKNNK